MLAIQDTTTLRDDGNQISLHLHPTIALDAADGAMLGLLDAMFVRHDGSRPSQDKTLSFDRKKSRRWHAASCQAEELLAAGAHQVTVVADREADIYETFACCPAGVDLLIRARHDRCLGDDGRLFACTETLAEWGRERIDVPASPGRKARQATLALRACQVEIPRPKRPACDAAQLPPCVRLGFVEAYEVDPPAQDTPIHWRLLTTHDLVTLADARQIIRLYRQRWQIEQLFRVMKTQGFDIEANRTGEDGAFENLATATLIAAVQVQQMLHDRDGTAKRPATDVFPAAEQPILPAVCRTLEGRTERQKNPHPPGSLAFAAWVCARLGGWTGYKTKPGPIVLIRGYRRLQAMIEGWKIRDVV